MKKRTAADVVYSRMTESHYCVHCGQPAILFSTEAICQGGKDCVEKYGYAEVPEDEEQDCAAEGYAVIERAA